MALFKRAEPAIFDAPRPLIASAARVSLSSKSETETIRQRSSVSSVWQNAAWQCYDNVGEVNYAFNYSASVLSRIRFHAAVVLSADSAPVDASDGIRIQTDDNGSTTGAVNGIDPRLAKLSVGYMRQFRGNSGMTGMVKIFGLNYQVAGECYLACINDKWTVKSTSELRIDASGSAILQPSASTTSFTPKRLRRGTPIGRIWNQHPRYSADPDSSLRAVLNDCEELILLARLMRVTARSRLNAGILFVSDALSVSARTVGNQEDPDSLEALEDEDPFEKELFETMTAPVAQEDSAAAIVPLVVRGPAEESQNIRYIQLARDVGTDLATRSASVLTRVLQGINAPKELATGISGSKYNNAQLIDEQSYKALVEPLALTFADAITEIFLRPMLRIAVADKENNPWVDELADINEQVERVVCWYDPSEVVTSVDQSAAASEGWDRHVLSDSAWLKANGFNDSDKPSEKELAVRLALAQVAIPPNIQASLFQVALPSIFAAAQAMNQQANGVGIPSDLSGILNGGGDGSTAPPNGSGTGDSTVAPSPPVPASSVPAGV